MSALGCAPRWVVRLLAGMLIMGLSVSTGVAQGSRADGGRLPGVHLLQSDESRIVVQVIVPPYTVQRQEVAGKSYEVVSIPEWGITEEAGRPQVPMRRLLVGIPPDAEVQLRVEPGTAQGAGPVQIAPAPEIVLPDEGPDPIQPGSDLSPLEWRYVKSPEVYEKDSWYPGVVARLAEVGFMRTQRVAAVELFPLQYNPGLGQIQFYPEVRIELLLSYPRGQRLARAPMPESPVYDQILQSQLVNYSSAKAWRSAPGPIGLPAEVTARKQSWPLPSPAYKIEVDQDGLYQLSYSLLAAAGVPVDTVDPRTFQLFSGGQEIAIRVLGEEDGRFDGPDIVLFYGQRARHKYTDRNVYWLIYGQAEGRRMPERDGQPVGEASLATSFTDQKTIEIQKWYMNLWPGDDSVERFYWEYLVAPKVFTTLVELNHIFTGTMTATLRASVWGYSSIPEVTPDHHAVFYVNGHPIGEHWWDGRTAVQSVRFDFPQFYITEGTNTLEMQLPGDTGASADSVMFDRFELSYGRTHQADSNELEFTQVVSGTWKYEVHGFTAAEIEAYDLTSPLTVTRIVNLQVFSSTVEAGAASYTARFQDTVQGETRYLVLTPDRYRTPVSVVLDSPSNLHDPSNGADYLLLSPAEFMAAAQELADYRASQGLRAMIVDLQDVYDEFGYGLSAPEAIRGFLAYAFQNWQPPAPTYALFMGDGHYDPKNYLNTGTVNYFPVYLAAVDPWMNETSADNRYGCVQGEDRWPDLIVGRFPVNSPEQAQTMVDKAIEYEQTMGGQDWNGRLTFVADIQPDPKNAGSFHDLSDNVIYNYVPPFYDVSRIYLLNPSTPLPSATCNTGAECKQQLLDRINAGTLLVNYIGHAAQTMWSGSKILDLAAISSMTNADRFPIMLPMTCLEGYFIWPYAGTECLGEAMVRATGRGSVASWSPAGLGVAHGHDQLNKGFLQAVLSDGIRELGPATYVGKFRLYQFGFNLDQIDTYHILGDPALRINRLGSADLRLEKRVELSTPFGPGGVLTYTLTFTNTGPEVAWQVVLTDYLPSLVVSPTVVYSSPEVLSQRGEMTLTWTITDLLPHHGGEVQIRATVHPSAPQPLAFINLAEIRAYKTPDDNPFNNSAWASVGLQPYYLPLLLKTYAGP
ncbi:MAG: C25 family cysteine peptidase [Anaerolineae bacterium]